MNTFPHSRLASQGAQRVTTLFVSPIDSDHAALKQILSHSNWNFRSAFTCKEAIALLRHEPIPIVICDRDLPDESWRHLLEKTEAMHMPPRLIVTSREVNEYLWAEVLQMGGYDLLTIPWDAKEVLKVISLAWRSWDFACRAAGPTRRATESAPPLIRAAAAGASAG